MIVPFAAGGPTDVIGRVVAEGMRASLGQPIIIENVTGAGGSIGVGRVARAAPDGYTISIGQWGSHVTNGAKPRNVTTPCWNNLPWRRDSNQMASDEPGAVQTPTPRASKGYPARIK